MRTRLYSLMLVAATALAGTRAEAEARTETFSRGPVEIVVSARPKSVALDRDMLLSIKIATPENVEAFLPASIADRLQGFEQRRVIEREPVSRDGRITLERQCLLTPVVAEEYRLAPFPVHYTDHRQDPPVSDWFATRPVVFAFDRPPGSADGIVDTFDPVRVWPGPKTWALYGLIALALAALVFLLTRLARKAEQAIRIWRMAPRERALKELADLLAQKLVEQGLVKEFYLALTLVVRRYIERAHKVRAPEQTTQEFLDAASHSPRFSPPALAKLKLFLEAADLVKFAAYRPAQTDIDTAIDTARTYIETDAADTAEEQGQNVERKSPPGNKETTKHAK